MTAAATSLDSIRRRARFAGVLYTLIAVTAPVGLVIVPGRLIVRGDALATAERIRESPWLLHAGMASELIHQVLGIFLVLALHRLFRSVDRSLAGLVVILGALVSVPIALVNVLNEVAALILARGAPFLAAFDDGQRDALAYLFLRLHGKGHDVASIFWGLWLFPFGLLVVRSGFIPRFLGVCLMLAGLGYLATATTSLVLPGLAPVVVPVAGILLVGEVPIIPWLLLWGARARPPGGSPPGR